MHLFRFLPTLVALLAFLLAVDAKPRRGLLLSRRLEPEERSLTNFERLKRNLPPRAPVLNRVLPGREALEPTPAWKIRRASPSPSASSVPIVFTGRVEIKRTTGQSVGYLNNTGSAISSVDINGTGGQHLEVKIATTTTGSRPFSILATNPLFKGPDYIGGGTNRTLASGSVLSVPLTNVRQTTPGAPASPVGASAIWTIDKSTLQLKAQWINSDRSSHATTIAFDSVANALFFVGNITAYNAATKTPADEVELFLVK